jgi:small GTP-binding protein
VIRRNNIVIDEAAVGKTTIANGLLEKVMPEMYPPTSGASILTIPILDDPDVQTIYIWDTGGTERYRALSTVFFRDSRLVVIFYDVTERISFVEVETWLTTYNEHVTDSTRVLIVGNKIDQVDLVAGLEAEGAAWTAQHQCEFITVSGKDGTNLSELLALLVEMIKSGKQPTPAEKTVDPYFHQSESCC